MKVFLTLILALLFTQLSFGATAQVNSIVPLGGLNANLITPDSGQTKTGGYFTIYCGNYGTNVANGNSFFPCYKDLGGTSNTEYRPTNGNTFKGAVICSIATTASNSFQLVQDQGAALPYNATTALTTPVYEAGATQRYVHVTSSTANTEKCVNATFSAVGVNTGFGGVGIQVANNASAIAVWVIGKETTP